MNPHKSLWLGGLGALLVLSACSTGPPMEADTGRFWRREYPVQIRVYADRGIMLPSGKRGGALQIYGIKLDAEGSERTVWRHLVREFNGLLEISHSYSFMPVGSNRVCLYFPSQRFLELDRDSGKVYRDHPRGKELYESLPQFYGRPWIKKAVTIRPSYDDMEPQRSRKQGRNRPAMSPCGIDHYQTAEQAYSYGHFVTAEIECRNEIDHGQNPRKARFLLVELAVIMY